MENQAMDLEIELTEARIHPSLVTQPNGRLRLTFYWHDEIKKVLELVAHPLREETHAGFLTLWAADELSRSFEQLNPTTVLIRHRQII